jgi:type I restriction enzyme S subunit
MSKGLPEVPLVEIAKPISRNVEVVPGQRYRTIGVKWWGEGAYERQTIDGSATAAKTLSVVRQGDLIINKIWVRHGSTAIAGADVDGCAASGEFPTFTLNETRVIPRWLHWQTKTRRFWAKCDVLSQGTSGKNRIKPELFLTIRVPLPSLAEQRRVVARIEGLAGQIHEAGTLRDQAAEEAEALLVAMAHRADVAESSKVRAGWKRKKLAEVIRFVDDSQKVQPDRSYPNLGIYSFGRGLFHKPPIDGLATSAAALRRVKAGQFIYSRLFAFEGAYGRVTKEFDGAFVSQEYPTFDCDARHVRSEFLAAYFKPAHIWKSVAAGSKGLGDRRLRVQPAQLLSHELWIPPVSWQNRLAEVQSEVDALKRLQTETAAELDALVPAILDRAFKGEL